MFEQLAKKLQTTVLVFLVTLISSVFVLQFGGPQARGCTSHATTFAARVDGTVISDGDFRANWTLAGFNRYPNDVAKSHHLKEIVLNGLIERTLLANKAREMGFDVPETQIWQRLADRGTVFLSLGVDAPPMLPSGEIPVPVKDRKGHFDEKAAKDFIQYQLRRSVSEFSQAQVEEVLAHRLRDVITSTVSVSPRAVWDAFVRERESAKVKYVRFSAQYYENTIQPTDAQLTAFIQAHKKEIDQQYQANRYKYTGLPKQVRARHILIKVDEGASDADKAAAKKKAQDLLARIKAGEDFATLARQYSQDPGTARKGGDLGWNPRGRMVKPFDDAQFALSPGQVSDVIKTRFGFHIIKVEGVREGDVPVADADKEIATDMYREHEAANAAHQAAIHALDELKHGKTMDQLDAELGGTSGAQAADHGTADAGSSDDSDADSNADPLSPRVHETDSFGRGDNPISGPFDSSTLVSAAFDMTMAHPLPNAPLKLGKDYFVFQLTERTEAKRADFTDDTQQRIRSSLLEKKRAEALRIYVEQLRAAAEADGEIHINQSVLSYGGATSDDNGG